MILITCEGNLGKLVRFLSVFYLGGPRKDGQRMRFGVEDVTVQWDKIFLAEEQIEVLERLGEEKAIQGGLWFSGILLMSAMKRN